MRLLLIMIIFCAGSAYAQTALGTRPSPVPIQTSTADGVSSLLQILVAVVVLGVALRWVVPRLSSRLMRGIQPKLGSSIRVEDAAAFAGGTLCIVRARHKTLLLSVSGTHVKCIADLSDGQEDAEPKTFHDLLEESAGTQVGSLHPAGNQLDRLKRFLQ